ncbi:MAG: WG repeat-containing protein [bacterium]|nr:WG repeat-containing protein [bacterium]
MKKFVILFITLMFSTCNIVLSAHHSTHSHNHNHNHYSYSTSQSKIPVGEDNSEETAIFGGCKEHSLKTYTKILYYSDGSRYTIRRYSILNKDDEILADKLSYVKHQITTSGKHYFIIKSPEYEKSKYVIIDGSGNRKTSNFYEKYELLGNNRIIVRQDKKWGIVDYDENIIADIKYNFFKPYGNLLINKYNGYYGVIDYNGKVILKNQYDKITKIGNIFVIKNVSMYGILNMQGNLINQFSIDHIKKDGDFFKVKIGNKYGILDLSGNIVAPIQYKKVRIERNNPEVYENHEWKKVNI